MYVKQCDVTSSNSLGDWFSVSRKNGTGGGGLVYPKEWKQHGCVWVWL